MSRDVFRGDCYQVAHTVEEDGPHITQNEHYCVDYSVLTVLFRGKGNCFVEGNRYALTPGDAVVLRSNELRHFQFEQGGEHERLSIYLLPSIAAPIWDTGLALFRIFRDRPLGVGNKLQLKPEDGKGLWPILEEIRVQMAEHYSDRSKEWETELRLMLLRLLVRLCAGEKTAEGGGKSEDDPAVRSVCQYVHRNLSEKLTYRCIEEDCRVSRYQLGEVFRRGTGMTLTEYIIQKRLIRVSELVLGGAKIEQAALAAGFRNYSHFYKMFTKYRGTSPKQYFSVLKET